MIVLFIISHETSMTSCLSTMEFKLQNNNNNLNKNLASTSQPLIHGKKKISPQTLSFAVVDHKVEM